MSNRNPKTRVPRAGDVAGEWALRLRRLERHRVVQELGRRLTFRDELAGLESGGCLLVGVSGGLDSTLLLCVLKVLGRTRGWRLEAAHLDHGLRGESAKADARFVSGLAEALGVGFHDTTVKVRAQAKQLAASVEMAGRDARHRFLSRTGRRLGAHHVVLGHHADDQLELFFLRLLRGTGGDGVGGMQEFSPSPVRNGVPLWRPFLGFGRDQLESAAAGSGIPFREDLSNQDVSIPRNRIRKELIPVLKQLAGNTLGARINRFMSIAREEALVVRARALDWLEAGGREPRFEELPIAIQRWVIRIQAEAAGVRTTFEAVEGLRREAGVRYQVSGGKGLVRRSGTGRLDRL